MNRIFTKTRDRIFSSAINVIYLLFFLSPFVGQSQITTTLEIGAEIIISNFPGGVYGNAVETNTIDYEHYINGNIGLETKIEIGGSGVTGGFEYKASKRFGQTQEVGTDVTNVLNYTLADDDGGDIFDLSKGVTAAAKEFDFQVINAVSEADVDYYEGYAVQGTKDGLNALISLLLDKESSTNLVISLVYRDERLKTVQKIYDSIYAYDP